MLHNWLVSPSAAPSSAWLTEALIRLWLRLWFPTNISVRPSVRSSVFQLSLRIFSAWLPGTHCLWSRPRPHVSWWRERGVNFQLCRIFYLLSTRNSITTDKPATLKPHTHTNTHASGCEYPRELFVPLSMAVLTYWIWCANVCVAMRLAASVRKKLPSCVTPSDFSGSLYLRISVSVTPSKYIKSVCQKVHKSAICPLQLRISLKPRGRSAYRAPANEVLNGSLTRWLSNYN